MHLAMSGDNGESVYDAKSGTNRRDVLVRLTSSRVAYVAKARSDMLYRVASETPWLGCHKLDTLASR